MIVRATSHVRPVPLTDREQEQEAADERRLEVIFEQILQQHAAEEDEYYFAKRTVRGEQQTVKGLGITARAGERVVP